MDRSAGSRRGILPKKGLYISPEKVYDKES